MIKETMSLSEPSNSELKSMLDSMAKASRDDARATAERFGEVKSALKSVDDRSIETRDIANKLTGRVDALERDTDRTKRSAQEALKSSSDLAAHVRSTEDATKRAVDVMAGQVRDVEAKVDQMSKEQTPLLREIRDEQIARRERDKIIAEGKAEDDKKHERRIKFQTIWIPVVLALVTLAGTYLSTRQAVADHDTKQLPQSAAHP